MAMDRDAGGADTEPEANQESVAIILPTYASLQASNLPGFPNPRYCAEVLSSGDVVEGEEEGRGEEGDIDDLPPPYSPGIQGQQSVFVAPPAYSTIFGQIREAREESTSHFGFFRKLCKIFLNTIGCTVLLLVFMSIPITILALGIYFIGDCPAEPNIPIFLVVGGLSGAVKNIALILENIVKRMSHRFSIESSRQRRYAKFAWRIVNLVFDLFLMAWIITGSYWVYHIYQEVDPAYDECHETLYKLAFGVITSSYILFVMMCCCMCFCGFCLIQRQADGGREGGGEDDEREEGEGDEEGGERGSSQSVTPRSLPPSPADTSNSSERGHDPVDIFEPRAAPHDTPDDDYNSTLNPERLHSATDGSQGTAGRGRRERAHVEPALSLDDLESVDVMNYQYTPVLSPRTRQLAADKQGPPQSPRTSSV